MVTAYPPETWRDTERPTVDDQVDRAARRLRAGLGGAILGSSVLSIMAGAIGYNTPGVQFAGAVIGFIVIYRTIRGEI